MSTRRVTVKIAIVILVAIIASVLVWLIGKIGLLPREISPLIIYNAILLITGFWLISILSGVTLTVLRPKVGNRAYTAANLLKFFGYIFLAMAALSALGVSPEVALAGGTFSGLVIGLGAQPILGNFFAGVVLLITGVVKAGDDIRLVSGTLPYQPAAAQVYKFFSPDYIHVGYRGTVVEVGLLFSTMTTDTGLDLKVPNQIVLNSAIANYAPAHSVERMLQVRYEFGIDYDPDVVLDTVKKSLEDVKGIKKIIINEQSDKEYYIVMIEFDVPVDEDWSLLKSEILRRLIKAHRSLRATSE